MSDLLDLSGLASPDCGDAGDAATVLASVHAAEHVRLLLGVAQEGWSAAGPLRRVLEAWCESDAGFRQSWGPAHGAVVAALQAHARGQPRPLLPVAVGLAMHLHAHGLPGSWEIVLDAPLTLTLGDARLRLEGPTSVTSVDGELRIVTPTRTYVFRGPSCVSGDSPLLPTLEAAGGVRIVVHDLQEDTRALRFYEEGLRLLDACAPTFAEWVAPILCGIRAVVSTETLLLSSSRLEDPGTVTISHPAPAAAMAEMFVHEASHQYAYLAQRLGPLCVPGHAQGYFSPVKGVDRPLGQIAIAFHAFANVLFVLRRIVELGQDPQGYAARNIRRHTDELAVMAGHLDGNPNLTDVGRRLVDPLLARLRR